MNDWLTYIGFGVFIFAIFLAAWGFIDAERRDKNELR